MVLWFFYVTVIFEVFKEAAICIVILPTNMTKFYQPLDLMVVVMLKPSSNINLMNSARDK